MVLLLLATRLALAGDQPADGRYALPDSGFTLVAPGWHMSRWSDYDFKGNNADNTVFATAWSTSYQLRIDGDVAKAIADGWKTRLEEEEHATEVKIDAVRVEDVAGVKRVRGELSFLTGGGIKGVYQAAAFPTEGLTAQVATLSTIQNRKRGTDALETLLTRLEVTRPPGQLGATEEIHTADGSALLPTGWRNPLAAEKAYLAPMYGKTGAKDADACTPSLRPRVGGEADLMLVCPETVHAGILDSNSFDDEAALVAQQLFGKGAASLPAPERVARGEDVAVLLHPKEGLWVGAVRTAKGNDVVWVTGRSGDDQALGDAARAVLGGLKLTPEATPAPSFGALMFHRLSYDPFHPTVLLPGLVILAGLAFLARMIFTHRPHPHDPHDMHGGHSPH